MFAFVDRSDMLSGLIHDTAVERAVAEVHVLEDDREAVDIGVVRYRHEQGVLHLRWQTRNVQVTAHAAADGGVGADVPFISLV